ncbi:cytochrome P450 4c3-like isoform X1 [Daphnia pulicaria]|uniref:cytochrome P450 4c3-like isoform X1 n=1 Tax=Daphnia pulicaria TaxID=35523 RepID=UPI001EEA4121|nr:cytochrome P450 4c3-like isoform X1 [Daphnia pulicaria]
MLSISWFATGWSPFSLAVTALAGMLAGYYWVWSRSRFVRLIDALPGPKPLPMLGNILHFANFSLDDVKYEPIYRIWIGYYPAVFVAHYKLFESILSNPKLINRPYDYEYLFHGESLSVFTDDAWRKRRRMLNPAFHFQNLNEFIGTFNDLSLDCAAELEQMLEAAQHKEIDVFPIMSKLTLDILSETSMGRKSWSEEETTNFVQCLERLEHVFMQRCFHQPWLRSDFIFKLSPLYRLEQRYTSISRSLIDKVIQNRLELQKKNGQCESVFNDNEEEDEFKRPKKRLAFLDLLFQAAEANPDLNDEAIRNEVFVFMGGGIDTTALALIWFLYVIAKHPDQQKLVTEELDLVFGDSDRPVTAQDLTQLKYLECCIKESLRLYPSLPVIARRLTEDVQAEGYTLPKGLTVILNIFSAHRNPEVYPDPHVFKPERFLPENSIGRHPYAYVPFSAGVRNCIGSKYAMLEVKVSLANLLRRFRFSVSDPSAPLETPSMQLLSKPKSGQCNLIVSKRVIS